METLDPAGELLRLAEHYRRLTEDELIALAGQKDQMTEAAEHALTMEFSSRGLTMPAPEPPVNARPAPPPDDSDDEDLSDDDEDVNVDDEEDVYAEDRKLVVIRRVWSEADARRLQRVLDNAGIPFWMGAEKATDVDDVTSDFTKGVRVRVMRIGAPWAGLAMWDYYIPKDERPEPKYEDAGDVAIHCPRCRSKEVVFEELVDKPTQAGGESSKKFQWKCDSCGYEWKDDGVETAG
jgi:DNA-directed RNA polymerase subunit M/transcription elongation factor TFIIS